MMFHVWCRTYFCAPLKDILLFKPITERGGEVILVVATVTIKIKPFQLVVTFAE